MLNSLFFSVVDYHAVKIDGRKGEFILAVNIYNWVIMSEAVLVLQSAIEFFFLILYLTLFKCSPSFPHHKNYNKWPKWI